MRKPHLTHEFPRILPDLSSAPVRRNGLRGSATALAATARIRRLA